MNLTSLSRLEKLVVDNSPVMLTAIGVVGTVTTAVLAVKAGFRYNDILHELEMLHLAETPDRTQAPEPITGKEKFEASWKTFAPPVCVGLLTISAIVGANHIGTRRAAGLAAAYTLSEKAYAEYRGQMIESLGVEKEQKLRDEIAQKKVSNTPGSREIVIVGTEVLCMDGHTGRYFKSNVEDLRRAENAINAQVVNEMYASLSDFYSLIGLSKTNSSDEVGWNTAKLLSLSFSYAAAEDGQPCLVLNYDLDSTRDYWRNY